MIDQRSAPLAAREPHGLRRRPSGEPPPLPRSFNRPTVVWLVAAAAIALVWIVLGGNAVTARAISIREGELLVWVASQRSDLLTDALSPVYGVLYVWIVPVVGWTTIIVLLVRRRWRHLLAFFVSLNLTVVAVAIAQEVVSRPRPFGVLIRGRWDAWSQPSRPVAMAAAVFVGAYCTLVPPGRLKRVLPIVIAVALVSYGCVETYLGVSHPTDWLTAILTGTSISLLGCRLIAPEEAFPVSYRTGKSAHLDVGGARGQAIRSAVEEQLGLAVVDIRPVGNEGSAGSTPLLLKVVEPGTRDPRPDLFAKLLAVSHLRADRWYKLVRTLLYGRLEDESRFATVRRLVQQEDYLALRFEAAGIRVPRTYGIIEITPEREYLLVTEFLDGFVEIGDATVDGEVIDNVLATVRRMWDAGLAHRDVKPANVMVRDHEVVLIDVAFGQIRPSPWRQAVDLANAMLVLALRSDAEVVYRRALGFFTPDEIAEAFAASRGITLPSQVRKQMRRDGRDLLGVFRRLAPPRPRIRIQRWSTRRVALMFWMALVVLVLLLLAVSNLSGTGLLP